MRADQPHVPSFTPHQMPSWARDRCSDICKGCGEPLADGAFIGVQVMHAMLCVDEQPPRAMTSAILACRHCQLIDEVPVTVSFEEGLELVQQVYGDSARLRVLAYRSK